MPARAGQKSGARSARRPRDEAIIAETVVKHEEERARGEKCGAEYRKCSGTFGCRPAKNSPNTVNARNFWSTGMPPLCLANAPPHRNAIFRQNAEIFLLPPKLSEEICNDGDDESNQSKTNRESSTERRFRVAATSNDEREASHRSRSQEHR